jgi:hypothetical protein
MIQNNRDFGPLRGADQFRRSRPIIADRLPIRDRRQSLQQSRLSDLKIPSKITYNVSGPATFQSVGSKMSCEVAPIGPVRHRFDNHMG